MTRDTALAQGIDRLGLVLPADAQERLLAFAALLLKWNRVYNLTAIREPGQIVSHHLLDSLAVVPHLGGIRRLADVGSGGGLPGIPLAIACPGIDVVSIEAVGKKASFQQQVRIELGLANFRPVHARAEAYRDEGFDGVISRAFADVADFARVAGPLAGRNGRLLAMKGVYPEAELAALGPGFALERSVALRVPELDGERHLIILKPDGIA